MSQSQNRDVIHSLDMIKQIVSEIADAGSGKCGGDCSNCPCSGEEPKSTKKASDNETSDSCDKC
jgi:hypothetical protein